MSFRTNLQYLRAQRNMTQERLAMLLGVSRQAISKWESDPSRWQDMQRIALNDTGASMVPGQSGIKRKQISGFRESASCALVREYESSSHKHHRERSPHYASYESSSRTEPSSSGMTATVLTSVFSRYFSAKSNVVDTITTPFLTCEPLTWHRRSPLPPAPTIEARRRARHKTAGI